MDKFERLFNINKAIFNLYGKAMTIKRGHLLLNRKETLKRNINLRNSRKSSVCFVIGLGPSLKSIDLNKLNGDIIVTNRFYRIQDTDKIDVTMYVINDIAFFCGDATDDFKEAIVKFPNTPFVLNGIYRDAVASMLGRQERFYYLYLWDGFFSGKKSVLDCTKILPMSSNVVITALYVALYMGYEEIYLLGCDFNSFASQKMTHVYKDSQEKRIWSMTTELFQYSFAAEQHVQLNIYANSHSQRIINLTEGSLIDAYERNSCEEYKK